MPPRRRSPRRFGGAVVVLEGAFNPAIFTPAWFVDNELADWEEIRGYDSVGGDESDNLSLYTDFELSRFEAEWFAVEARRDRITFATTPTSVGYEDLGDLVARVFDILVYSPVYSVALSRAEHVAMSMKQWNALAALVAPPERWSEFIDDPELATLTVRGQRADEPKGSRELVLERSQFVKGAYVVATRQFDLGEPQEEEARGASGAVAVLREHWKGWLREADSTLRGILDLR